MHLGSLLLKLLDGALVDAATLVDEVPGGGRLARVHVADDNDVDMGLLLAHGGGWRVRLSLLPEKSAPAGQKRLESPRSPGGGDHEGSG